MSSSIDKIKRDLKSAMKDRNELLVSTLRLVLNAIVNKEKEKRAKIAKSRPEFKAEELLEQSRLEGDEIVGVLQSEAKKRKEAIIGFEKGQRPDLAEKEKKELEVLQSYLPEQISEEEIRKLAQGVINQIGASGLKDMGKVMSELMPQLKGKSDGNTVSNIVKVLLS